MRILLDTNVLVSGLISGLGPSGRVLDAWFDRGFELLSSPAQLQELGRVLRYQRIATRLPVDRVERLLRNLSLALMAEPVDIGDWSPDPDDSIILATAVAGNATLIVSGDKRDMVQLKEVGGIPIVTARRAAEQLGV